MGAVEPTASATELVATIAGNTDLQQQVIQDPVGVLQRLAKPPADANRWIYGIAVVALGLTMLFVVSGVFILKALDNKTAIPDALVAIGSAAVGALAGLLAPTPGGR
jgi:hypothetical protein